MERKTWIRALLLGVLAVAVLLGGGSYYLSRMRQSIWEQSVDSVLEVTTQGGHAFEVYVDQGVSMMDGRANNFAQYASTDVDAIGAKLDLYGEGDPTFAVVDLTHGMMYFNSAERKGLPRDRIEEYLALPDQGALEPYVGEYYNARVIGFYERFTFADGAEGMVRKSVSAEEVAEEFSLSFYDGAGFSCIINRKGDILLRSGSEPEGWTANNLFDAVALDKGNDPQAAEMLRQGASDGKRGLVTLHLEGEPYIFAYVPVNAADGWYLVSIIPDEVITDYADRVIMNSRFFVLVIAAAAVVLGAFLLMLWSYRRRIKAQQAEVLYREQLFNMLANNTNDVFFMLSADGKTVEYISPTVERVTGVPRELARRDLKNLQSVIHGGDESFDLEAVLATPLGQSVSFEGQCVHQGTGEQRWYAETVYHTVVEDTERYIVVLADRTEDRQKEAALTEAVEIAKVANDAKSAFLSNMSHDIRTPMNAIVGLCTLLQRDADDPDKVRTHTRKITASSQHLLGLINDVLDMSKIESGKTTLNIGAFDLAELVDELSTITRPQAKAKHQTFEVSVQDVREEALLGDRLRIGEVLLNILSNAVKYTPEGGRIDLTVRQLGQVTQNIARFRFTVTDNGIGMSEDYQKQIFQPFTREARALVDRTQGTGLGMAITKNLVDLMGGAISVESALGEGTTFTVELDLRIQEREEDGDFWKEHNISNTLVVDDEAEVCTGILTAMAGTGVSMQFALDGATAVHMTQLAHREGKDYDLILLDWKMPGMDGLETARQIRSKVPAHIPIMILTAYDIDEIWDEGIKAGIDGFLAKPFFLSNFKEVIRTLDASKPRQTAEEREKKEGALKGKNFLCAEDNELNAEILRELLDMEGATCQIAGDGQQAVELFAAAPAGTFDAVLMDVQMPVMNGYDATRTIRTMDHPQAGDIPIVAMTANAFADDVRQAMEAGMNAHIAKPVDMDHLVTVLSGLWADGKE